MLRVGSALKGYTIAAVDGETGTVSDLLFDDRSGKVRWMVVDTGSWLMGRKVMLDPSVLGKPDYVRRIVPVALTKAQVADSPKAVPEQPVSQLMESSPLPDYAMDAQWGGSRFERGTMDPSSALPSTQDTAMHRAAGFEPHSDHEELHLCSMVAVTGCHCIASDGPIGHVEDFLVEDDDWNIRYLIIDTRNWWPGRHVLVSPSVVKQATWSETQIRLTVTCAQVKASPPWDPLSISDQADENQLHHYDGWTGHL